MEALLPIELANPVIELLGVVVEDDDDDDDEPTGIGLTTAFEKRNGTSSVKWSSCGKCECSILKGKPRDVYQIIHGHCQPLKWSKKRTRIITTCRCLFLSTKGSDRTGKTIGIRQR